MRLAVLEDFLVFVNGFFHALARFVSFTGK